MKPINNPVCDYLDCNNPATSAGQDLIRVLDNRGYFKHGIADSDYRIRCHDHHEDFKTATVTEGSPEWRVKVGPYVGQ